MRWAMIAIIALILAGCEQRETRPEPAPTAPPSTTRAKATGSQAASSPPTPVVAKGPPATAPALRWDLQSSGEGIALALVPASGPATIRLFCPAGKDRLLVNVPAFRPVASEERLSFGSGGAAVALVADANGDHHRGGVTATSEVPDNLAKLVGGPLSASYGAQASGPHPAPPKALSRDFVAACREAATGMSV